MSSKIYKTFAHYFCRLGLAVLGRDYVYSDVYIKLEERIGKSEADFGQLKEMYDIALGKWKQLADAVARLNEEVLNYQRLVETLRSTINDKQALIDAYEQSVQENNLSNE